MGNFRSILDSCGADGADLALQQLSRRLQATLRPGDSLARLVNDEMLLMLENSDSDNAIAAADRLYQLLLKPMRVGTLDVVLDCSIGIAAYPTHGNSPDDLLRRAAIAMQDAAQQSGRLELYQEGRDGAHQRQISWCAICYDAAEPAAELSIYQPKLDIPGAPRARGRCLLALERSASRHGVPGQFIPLAERTGASSCSPPGSSARRLRCSGSWNGHGLVMQVSLNDSGRGPGGSAVGRTGPATVLAEQGVAAEQLVFDITESTMMRDQQRALDVLLRLRACGIQLSVDDFGTGYSSLAQLKRMPVQELKIDQSFIRELDEHSEDAVIVRSTIEMSHSLGLKVVAEGVELAPMLELLARWGCDTAQGYLIGKPMPAAAFEQWLRQWQGSQLAKVF